MVKLILFLVLGYALYRFYLAPIKRAIDDKRQQEHPQQGKKKSKDDDDDSEYIDYEEVK